VPKIDKSKKKKGFCPLFKIVKLTTPSGNQTKTKTKDEWLTNTKEEKDLLSQAVNEMQMKITMT
jgi:hypothetical protein